MEAAVSREDLNKGLKNKITSEKFTEMREQLLEFMSTTGGAGEKHDREMKRLDADMAKRYSDLNSILMELKVRVKTCEDEIAEGVE